MLDRHRHADRTILVFHQLNRTYHNAANSQLAQRNLQDVNNPMVLFVLFQALEREDAGIPTQKKLASCSCLPGHRGQLPEVSGAGRLRPQGGRSGRRPVQPGVPH